MNGIIIYRSKYGAAKKYAEWLSGETGFEYVELKKADIKKVAEYDTIIFGGGIYAMGIAGLSFLRKNIDKLSGKKIAVYFTCASPYDEDAIEQVKAFNMKDTLSGIPVFFCRGTFDLASMSFGDRTLCRMLMSSVRKKDPADLAVWERALVEAGEDKNDWTDKKYIGPIVDYIRQ
ncbi:MAG: flavodoxin [Ruminiclostridium sp.]|nr:flavodoxin [Ruminiclostridium sp.]